MNGKGDSPRPYKTKQYQDNYNEINWKSKQKYNTEELIDQLSSEKQECTRCRKVKNKSDFNSLRRVEEIKEKKICDECVQEIMIGALPNEGKVIIHPKLSKY